MEEKHWISKCWYHRSYKGKGKAGREPIQTACLTWVSGDIPHADPGHWPKSPSLIIVETAPGLFTLPCPLPWLLVIGEFVCPSFSLGYTDKIRVRDWGLSRMRNNTGGCWTMQLSQGNLVLTGHRKPPALTVWPIIKDYRHNTSPRFVSATSSRGLWWAWSVLLLRVSESLDLRWWDNQLSVLHGKP